MRTDIFTLCDSAQEYNGKLVIIGTFNEIVAQKFPTVHPEMAIVARATIEEGDQESYDMEISAIDEQTGEAALFQPLKAHVDNKGNKVNPTYSNMIVRLNNLVLQKPGKYIIRFRIGDVGQETKLIVKGIEG